MQSSPRPPARFPLLFAACAFSIGILLAQHLHRPAPLWGWGVLAAIACCFAALLRERQLLAEVCSGLALALAGAFALSYTLVPAIAVPPQEFLYGPRVEVTGFVVSDGAFLAGSGPRERFDVQTEQVSFEGRSLDVPIGMRATLFTREYEDGGADEGTQFPQLVYGQRVKFTARLRLPRNFHNPGAFDYEGYLHDLGISTLASVRAEDLQILPGLRGSRLGRWRSAVRRSILRHISDERLWSRGDAALFAAMIVGDDSLLMRNVREEFQETGVYHLLVVSGMNVGLLSVAVFWIARRLHAPQWASSVVTIVLAVFYAAVAGMGIPILRAVLMLCIFLIARLLYRDRASLNATALAALCVLVFSPRALFEPAFQLTFLALLAIFGIGVPLLERSSEPYRKALAHLDSTAVDLSLEPRLAQFRLDLRLVAGRLAPVLGPRLSRSLAVMPARVSIAFFNLTTVSLITQAVLVLPMRAYFHRAAIIGLPANVLVLPLSGVLLNGAVLAIALSYVSMPLARCAAWVATVALHWILRSIGWLAHLQISQWRIPDGDLALLLLATAGITAAIFMVRRRRALATVGLATLLVSAAFVAFYLPRPQITPGKLEITAIDVGQGDSLLVVSPEGRTLLIDGGGSIGPVRGEFDYGEDVVSPYLWSRGIEKLDVVVLTHAHGDHIGGLPRVLENFHPTELWLGINPQTPALERLERAAAAHHVSIRQHLAGESFAWSGTQIHVLSPPAGWVPKQRAMNDDSLALLITFGNSGALLAGDLEKKMEKFIAAQSPRADLLKVAHHGSATSTTRELLDAVQPSYSVISAGYRNSFGHPRPVVLQRLQDARVRTYRTDMLGAITFLLDGKSVQVETAARP